MKQSLSSENSASSWDLGLAYGTMALSRDSVIYCIKEEIWHIQSEKPP